jgi:predicted transport protein
MEQTKKNELTLEDLDIRVSELTDQEVFSRDVNHVGH